ncbi:MAG: ABC transporter permease [Acidimicrobiia bacterium]|nr:ABC transporter permease [Acidimicrobiia bacterium]
MTAALLRARAELRARRRSWVALAALIGLGAAAVLAAIAAGRRTDTAYPRFVADHRAGDVQVFPPFTPEYAQVDYGAASRLPQVRLSARVVFLATTDSNLALLAPEDATYGRLIDQPKVLRGRMPRADELGAAAIPFTVANSRHLRVGSRLTVQVISPLPTDTPPGPPVAVTLRVVGIEATPGEFPPQTPLASGDHFLISRAQGQALATRVPPFEVLVLSLRRGAGDVAAVENGLNRLSDGRPILSNAYAPQAANVQRSLHLQAVALWVVGGLLGLVLLLVAGQLLARQSFLEASDNATLAALGMTADQLWMVGLIRAAAVGAGAAVVAALTAIALSPLTPLGTARTAEPHPGIAVDPLVLGVGAVVLVIAVVAAAAVPTWRLSRVVAAGGGDAADVEPARRSLAAILVPGVLPPTAGVGVRMALQPGRGRSTVPVRSSLTAVSVALAALVAAVTFGASLGHMLSTPRLYGSSWDAVVTTTSALDIAPAVPAIAADHHVSAVAIADTGTPLAIGGQKVDGLVLKPVRGLMQPTVVAGRAPTATGELLLGTKTLHRLRRAIGDQVTVQITVVGPHPVRFRIVGSGVLPPTSDAGQLGEGAAMTYDSELRLAPPGITIPVSSTAFVRFAPGANRRAAMAALARDSGDGYAVLVPPKPTDIVNFGRVSSLPVVVAILLGLLAAATLAHTLVTSIQRRRRDLAVLKTLGFLPSQVRRAVAWQATSFCAAALVIAIPVGAVVGRWAWDVFARQIGTIAEPVVPPVALLVLVPASVLLANLVAATPAFVAGRILPAPLLRTE